MSATEPFRNVAAHRLHCVFGLRVQFQVAPEIFAVGKLVNQHTYLVRELPHDEVLMTARRRHAVDKSTHDAERIRRQFAAAHRETFNCCDVASQASTRFWQRDADDF